MHTKKDLKKFLEDNSRGAKFTKFVYASDEKFHIELKCGIDKDQSKDTYDRYTREWIKKFSKFTATAWIVRSSFTKLKRLVFRKIYTCNRSSFNKKKKPDFETRNQDCKAKIDFRVKFINRNTIKNDEFLKDGLNLTISIDFNHSHNVRTPEAYNLLKHSSEIDEVFQLYFDTGCSTTAAKSYHELTLIDKYGDNCPEVFLNTTINPTLRHVSYLYGKIRKKDNAPVLGYRDIMKEKQSNLKEIGVDLDFLPYKEISVVVTPIMKRVIAEISLEYLLIDSTEIPQGPTVTYFFVPTKIGALPIACAIYVKSSEGFSESLQLIKLRIEMETGKTFMPKVCSLNDYEEKNLEALALVAPDCKKLMSRYALSSETWRFLCDDDMKVDRKRRHALMMNIKTLLYAESLEKAEKIYVEFKNNETMKSAPKLREYMETLWNRKDQWITEENYGLSNSLVEISIRFLKEFLARKCKSFTDPLMVDVVTNILENHYKRILISYVKKSESIATYTKFLEKAKVVLTFGSDVRRISANEFRIELHSKPKKYLHFRTDTMCCNCIQGKKGVFCDHLTAIVNTVDCDLIKHPVLNEEDVTLFTRIAGDDEEDQIKPEMSEDEEDFEIYDDKDDIDKVSEDYDEEGDVLNEEDNQETHLVTSNSKLENSYYTEVEVKMEKQDSFDPLEEESGEIDQTEFIISENNQTVDITPTTSNQPSADMKRKYETALRAVNDEFRRLNRYFSEHPNSSNLATMTKLARELSKIRPVDKINLDNMHIQLNHRKRKRDE